MMTPEELQARVREVFKIEAKELVAELESALLELEEAPADPALINRVFRALHTLKGSGATSGFAELSQFLHHVEDVFYAAREGRITVEAGIVDRALAIKDAVLQYMAASADTAGAVLRGAQADLDGLLAYLPEAGAAAGHPRAEATAPREAAAAGRFLVRFEPSADLFRSGSDPGMFLDDLRALGTCVAIADEERIPDLAQLDPESNHLAWRIDLATTAGIEAVRDVFMFVADDCQLSIEPVSAGGTDSGTNAPTPRRSWVISFATDASLADSPGALEGLWRDLAGSGTLACLEKPGSGEIGSWRVRLDCAESVTVDQIRDAFIFLPSVAPTIAMEAPVGHRPDTGAVAAARQPSAARAAAQAPASNHGGDVLRVSAAKLDRLVDMVGELVILRSLVGNACATMAEVPGGLASASEGLDRLTKELRDVVLGIRMMPVGETFATFRRLCRDLARDLGKEVDLEIEGAETEIDKTMLEHIKDPLVHLVRNCMDHGFELPAERERAGKPRRGTLRLSAAQEGDRVCLTVADDGRGLDTARIRAKAVERGLVAPEAKLSEKEVQQLIFLAGFSTAERVSEVSGRGVGMDVVKRAIEALRGTIEIESKPGRGTTVTLSVPLTLAIIEGLMVGVDGDRYILPLSSVLETITFDPSSRTRSNGRNLVELRRELVPYVDLRDVFAAHSGRPREQRAVIVECDGSRVGLVVDVVFGNHQTVIKPLGWAARQAGVFSGSTILGDGRVALICDIPALVARAVAAGPVASGLQA